MRTPARPLALAARRARGRCACTRVALPARASPSRSSCLPPSSSPGLVKVRPRCERPSSMHAAFACHEARLCACPSTPPLNPVHSCLLLNRAGRVHRPATPWNSICTKPNACSVCTACWQALQMVPSGSCHFDDRAPRARAAPAEHQSESELELEQRQQRPQRRQQQQCVSCAGKSLRTGMCPAPGTVASRPIFMRDRAEAMQQNTSFRSLFELPECPNC